MRFLYTAFFYLLVPFILLRLGWRARLAPAYAKRWAERFGFVPPLHTTKKVVWLHTVSVGEFIAALPLVKKLQGLEGVQLVITTTTPTGSERVKAALGNTVVHVYAPYDLPDVVARFITRIKPSLYLVMETELWPNTIAICAQKKIPSLLLNGRMSEKSARGYGKFSGLTKPMLASLTNGLIQNARDAARLNSLGLPKENTLVTGSVKFDINIDASLELKAKDLKAIYSNQGKRLVWIAASTHLGEDDIILAAHKKIIAQPQLEDTLLVLVPRHPERFESVANLAQQQGFQINRRSENVLNSQIQVLIGNTMGELMLLFGASDVAFVGGSLVPNGGHNFIEPAAWGLPLLSGPHLFNFAEVSNLMLEAGALAICNNAEQLAKEVIELANSADERKRRGKAGLHVVEANRGALDKTFTTIQQYLN